MLKTVLHPTMSRVFTISCMGIWLCACQSDHHPDKSWENAVKGTYSAALSNDGELGIVGSITHGGSLWQTEKGVRLYDWNHQKGEFTNIIACGFSPDAKFALTADHQTMVLWSTESGKALTYWTAPNEVLSVALTANGNYALLGLGDHSMVLFDVKRGGVQRTFYHSNRVRSVALSVNGELALSGSDDQTARLWNVKTGDLLFNWQHQESVVTVALAPSGNRAFTVAKYDEAVIWDTTTGKAIGKLPLQATAIKRGQAFTSAAFSADGKLLLTGTSDRLVQLWDADKLIELRHWIVPKRDPWKPTSASIAAVSFSTKKHRYYAIASNGFTHRLER